MHAPKQVLKPYICHGTGRCTLLQQDGTRVYHTCTSYKKIQPEVKAEKFHSPKNRMRKVEELKKLKQVFFFFGSTFYRFFVVIPESSNGSFIKVRKKNSTEPSEILSKKEKTNCKDEVDFLWKGVDDITCWISVNRQGAMAETSEVGIGRDQEPQNGSDFVKF